MRYSTLDSLSLDVRSASLDELVLASVEVKTIVAGYEVFGLQVPDRVSGIAKDISREVVERVRVEKERVLKTKKARRAALATPDEKRSALDDEIAALEKELA